MSQACTKVQVKCRESTGKNFAIRVRCAIGNLLRITQHGDDPHSLRSKT